MDGQNSNIHGFLVTADLEVHYAERLKMLNQPPLPAVLHERGNPMQDDSRALLEIQVEND